jgi:hypothetical protein
VPASNDVNREGSNSVDLRETKINAACDSLTVAIASIIAARDEKATRAVVPELDRVRSFLLQRVTERRIRLDEPTHSRAS